VSLFVIGFGSGEGSVNAQPFYHESQAGQSAHLKALQDITDPAG
jgi:hypothetical protein